MKKIFIIAAMAILSVAASAQNLKFGYVNYTELVQLMPEMDSVRVQIEAQALSVLSAGLLSWQLGWVRGDFHAVEGRACKSWRHHSPFHSDVVVCKALREEI